NEGAILARRTGRNGLGNQLFSGAAFALNEDRRAAGSDLRHQIESLKHCFALADDIFEAVTLLESALQLPVLFLHTQVRDRGANIGEQFLVVPRLLDEV